MGLKRITFVAEVTFPADDERTLAGLAEDTEEAVFNGLDAKGGLLARMAIQGAAEDPDPEPTAPEEPAPGGVYLPEPEPTDG